MRFEIEHRFPADPKTVIAKMFDPEIGPVLAAEMKNIQEIENISQTREGTVLTARTRYLPAPLIAKVGPLRVEPRWMEWIAEFQFDEATSTGSFKNIPTTGRVAKLMDNHGTIEFRRAPDGSTIRTLKGELKIKVMILGRIAEKIIHKNAVAILDEEAEVMRRLL
jgi:uncharacterized membrane protein